MKKFSDLSYQDVKREVESGRLRPVYYVRGDEDFLKQDITETIVRTTVDDRTRDFNYHRFDAAELDVTSFATLLITPPMMYGKRLLHVGTAQKMSPKAREAASSFAANPSLDVILLMVDQRKFQELRASDKSPKFLQSLTGGGGAVVTCWNLYEADLLHWVRDSFRRRGMKISEETALFFVDAVGEDLTRLDAEAEKLVTYASGQESVQREHIESVTGRYSGYTIFELLHITTEGRVGEALQALDSLRRLGESPVRIIYWLARHYIQLGRLTLERTERDRRAYLTGKSRLPRAVISRHLSAAARHDEKSVRESLGDIYAADRAIKQGEGRPEIVIERLITGLALRAEERRHS